MNRYPLLRSFVAFTAGLTLAVYLGRLSFFPQFLGAIAGVLVFSGLLFLWRKLWLRSPLPGLAMIGLFFSLGYLAPLSQFKDQWDPHPVDWTADNHAFTAIVISEPEVKPRSVKVFAKVQKHDCENCRPTKTLIYLEKSVEAKNLLPGDYLAAEARFSKIEGPKNPHQFDYRNFLELKQVFHQAYLPHSAWELMDHPPKPSLKRMAVKVRQALIAHLKKAFGPTDETAIAEAVLLGYKQDITPQIRNAYAASGALHVLAVSGLHVGIIYLLVEYILGLRTGFSRFRGIRIVTALLLIWAYALLTGLSPSVTRATTMFSLVAIARIADRNTSIYNTILASAFLLLIFNPFFLFEVGFQLSYAAVLGIVVVQPRLYRIIPKPKNWFVEKAWAILCVSVAAQLGTFPLALYYFHQFPVLFMFSNLLVIPLITFIMYGGIPLLVLSFLLGNTLLLWPIKWLIFAMNRIVNYIDQIEFSLINGLWVSRWEMTLLYIIIAMLLFAFFRQRKRPLQWALGLTLMMFGFRFYDTWQLKNQEQLVIYSVPNNTVVGGFSPREAVLLADEDFLHDDDSKLFHVARHLWSMRNPPLQEMALTEDTRCNGHGCGLWFHFAGKSLMVVKSREAFEQLEILQPDLALICVPSAKDLAQKIPEGTTVVLSNTLRYYQKQKWEEELSHHNLDFEDLDEGALVFVREI